MSRWDALAADEPVTRAILMAIPAVAGRRMAISPLDSGITNLNYLVDIEGAPDRLVVRISGADTHDLGIDRRAEAEATRTAAGLGIGPDVVALLADEGILITRYIDGRQLEASDLRSPGMLARLASALRRLHDGPAIPGIFDALTAATTYLARARERGVGETALERDGTALARHALQPREGRDVEPRPCHNDLLAANLIDDGSAIRIVDWEYAAMGDPTFDLGNLAANNELDVAGVVTLLTAYDGAPPGERRIAEVTLQRIASDYREAAWGVLQQAISRLDIDFSAYAERHFARMLATASSAGALTRGGA